MEHHVAMGGHEKHRPPLNRKKPRLSGYPAPALHLDVQLAAVARSGRGAALATVASRA